MKLIKKNLQPLLIFIFLGLIIGSLGWDILERLIGMGSPGFTLSTGPVGFDLGVISIYLKFNPGSLAGIAGSVLLFKSL